MITSKGLIDIGADHSIKFVEYGDETAGINVYHLNNEGDPCVGWVPFRGSAWDRQFEGGITQAWDVQSAVPLTISPSVLCTSCKDHGFIRNGKWEIA
jgi:hypothetical protein